MDEAVINLNMNWLVTELSVIISVSIVGGDLLFICLIDVFHQDVLIQLC